MTNQQRGYGNNNNRNSDGDKSGDPWGQVRNIPQLVLKFTFRSHMVEVAEDLSRRQAQETMDQASTLQEATSPQTTIKEATKLTPTRARAVATRGQVKKTSTTTNTAVMDHIKAETTVTVTIITTTTIMFPKHLLRHMANRAVITLAHHTEILSRVTLVRQISPRATDRVREAAGITALTTIITTTVIPEQRLMAHR